MSGGDLSRTLGTPPLTGRTTLNELPIDLLEVRLDDSTEVVTACAHVVVRSPWTRGSWWRGPLLLVMNAEFRGNWDVAPRGHPNDGRVEVFEVDRTFSLRDRLRASRRIRSATHVPHPGITTRSVRTARWTFDAPMQTFVDGDDRGRATTVDVVVVADAAHILA